MSADEKSPEPLPHVLIVDDDTRIRGLLASFLRRKGFRVSTAASAAQARAQMAIMRFDALVLDIMMPGESGLELTEHLRDERHDVPILMLSALGEPADRINGLRAGSDDYMSKPFEPEELLLRLQALLRRAGAARADDAANAAGTAGAAQTAGDETSWLRLGEALRLNPQTGELRAHERLVNLSSREREILRLLARTPNQPVPREKLLAPGDNRQARSVDVEIARLRRKLEADPASPRHIRTVRGEGYMLVAGPAGETATRNAAE